MRIRWKLDAANDLESIHGYLLEHCPPRTAKAVVREIRTAVRSLRKFPRQGRPGHVRGTRELVCGQNVIIYMVEEYSIQILRVWSPARSWDDVTRDLKAMVQ